MKADELVEEIHFYFSEFDRIVTGTGSKRSRRSATAICVLAGCQYATILMQKMW